MERKTFDIIVVGAGIGGYTAALKAAALGKSVGIVEAGLVGGTCLNVGCIPTKGLLESTKALKTIEKAPGLGIDTAGAQARPEAMVERSDSVVAVLRKGVEDLLARGGIEILKGTAKLLEPGLVRVASEAGKAECEARSIILATGSRWIDLPGIEIDGDRIITSDHALRLVGAGEDLVIVGAGAVGCEFAEVYSALGSKITIVEMLDQIVPGEDTELARRLEAALKRKGIKVLTGTKVAGIDAGGERLAVRLDGADDIVTDRVLIGVGRKPNTEGLGLEDIGVEFEGKAVKVDPGMRTSVPGVFAVGDVTGKFMLAHVALAQGVVAGRNAGGMESVMEYEAIPRCVYSDPELAAVGLTESRARERGIEVSVHKVRLGQIGRALTMGETFGLAKIVYESGTGRVLGFHALGPHASELLSEVTLAIRKGLKVEDIAGTIHAHPTLSEIIWECADGALGDMSRPK
ncbi:MAG: dihydrolipoyl dehydrogenase [bacterium]|jgi:dihydrolipoamide dehydrogenase